MARPMSEANVKAIRFTSAGSAKRSRREISLIAFDRSPFCAYKFRVDLFTRGPLQEKDSMA
jgi:hypothetical protein